MHPVAKRGVLTFSLLMVLAGSARNAQAQLGCLLGDVDGDGLDSSWEQGCGGGARTACNDADSDDDLVRDDVEVGATGSPLDPRDTDGDGVIDACDPDSDGDGIPDAVEAGCSVLCTNPVNTDGDGLPDYRDPDSDDDGTPDAAEGTGDADQDGIPNYRDPNDTDGPAGDLDGDTVLNPDDNCPDDANLSQVDTDADGAGDACDDDDDDDGIPDDDDNCILIPNANQVDNDADGNGDVCDPDDDDDGVDDGEDNCPLDANTSQADVDGDGIGNACDTDTDEDEDGVQDGVDLCPEVPDPEQADLDSDRIGDACDEDDDDDGVPDEADNCPRLSNNLQVDTDGDGVGDACDDDDDDDGVVDADDTCPLVANPPPPGETAQEDMDGDGMGDACDPDDDGDGVDDDEDNCPGLFNPFQEDDDGDQIGDACDDGDEDRDGVIDRLDNCPTTPNADQVDADGDGAGDACDEDADGDSAPDADDNCPGLVNDQTDTDGDGAGDPCDADADGDGVADDRERGLGTNPLDDADRPRAQSGGGCSGTGVPAEPWALGLALGVWLLLRRRKRALGACALVLIAAEARGQSVDAQLLRPAPLDRGGAAVESAAVLPAFAFQAAIYGGHAARPVELAGGDGRRLSGVIDGLSSIDLRLTLGLPERFEVSGLMPVRISSTEEAPAAIRGAGVGDASLWLKWAPLDRRIDPVGVSVRGELFLPTGDQDQLAGEGGVGGGVTAAVDRDVGPVMLAANIGARIRDGERRFEGASVGQQITFGGVADVEVLDGLHLAAELFGAAALDGDGASPIEALGSARYRIGPVILAAGGGAGVKTGLGASAWRVFGGVAYSFEPGGDSDGDGVVDAHDACPDIAEDRDGFEDGDGCPDTDNDADGIPDRSDACVFTPEDLDGFEDDDGCPDRDDDGDGIVDTIDACPRVAETINRFLDEDGCPDQAPKYVFEVGERLVFDDIEFATGSYELLPVSFPVLDEIVASLQEQPKVRVRVEGHADEVGDARSNLVLSQQRALAVVNYLIAAGVDAKRVEHAGFGDTRPVAGNDTPEQRAQNRRVELVTLGEGR